MKSRSVVLFTDVGLHRQLKVRCAAEGQAMTAVVQALVRGWLEADAAVEAATRVTTGPEAKPTRPVTSPLPRVLRAAETHTVVDVTKVTTAVAAGCQRCGHERAAHWIKGCLGGCLCSEQRYRPPVGGESRSLDEASL